MQQRGGEPARQVRVHYNDEPSQARTISIWTLVMTAVGLVVVPIGLAIMTFGWTISNNVSIVATKVEGIEKNVEWLNHYILGSLNKNGNTVSIPTPQHTTPD